MFKEPNSISPAAVSLNTVIFSRSVMFSSLLEGCVLLNGDIVKATLKLTTVREHESVMEG